VLSHGHLDHYGGLEGFLLKHRSEMKDEMSLYVGGEDAFAPRWEKIGPLEPDGTTQAASPWGELDREM
jgi:7,8-dihydropterin-6-yl-methyl-4-(beta-D-ribofuranosyl)aminobenzene 5'-phosphate synthase